MKVDDVWFDKNGFTTTVYPCNGTDNLGSVTTGSLKLFEKRDGKYGTRSYKFIRIEHHNTITKTKRGKTSRSNWYMLSASGNGFGIIGQVSYKKYTEEEIINILNVVGLCTK